MATSLEHQRSKQPVNAAAGPYGHPTHPMLVPIPIGAWVASLIFDVASRTSDDGRAFVRGALLLVAVGVVGGLAAAVFGFLDYTRLASGTKAARTATVHMVLNVVVTAGFAAGFLLRRGEIEERTSGGLVALSVVLLLVLSVSGWLGGRMSYHYGIRVADERTQAEAFETVPSNRLRAGDARTDVRGRRPGPGASR